MLSSPRVVSVSLRVAFCHLIFNSPLQCHTLHLNFCPQRQEKGRRKVKRLSGRFIIFPLHYLPCVHSLVHCCIISYIISALFWKKLRDVCRCLTCNWNGPIRAKYNHVRISLTGTVRSLSSRWVEGTKYPPMLAIKLTRSNESTSSAATVDEELLRAVFFLTGEGAFGEVAGGRGGAPMTWTIVCVSTLWISIVSFGRRDVI